MSKMEDIKIIKHLIRNGREYGQYIVNDILIIQNEDDYKAVIHSIDKNVEDCLEYVTDDTIKEIKKAIERLDK